MAQSQFPAIALSAALFLITGCSESAPTPEPSPPAPEVPKRLPSRTPLKSRTPVAKATATPQADPFPDALDIAAGAATITQSAVSRGDWQLVVGQWQQAIALLKAVPPKSPHRTTAQRKIQEYQKNLAYAQQRLKQASVPPKPPV